MPGYENLRIERAARGVRGTKSSYLQRPLTAKRYARRAEDGAERPAPARLRLRRFPWSAPGSGWPLHMKREVAR
jgi:hypothetical protein